MKTPDRLQCLYQDWIDRMAAEEREQKNLSAASLEEHYAIAYQLYQTKRYDEAQSFFEKLVSHDTLEIRYWLGLGSCLQMQKSYEKALEIYALAQLFLVDCQNPHLFVQAADCCFILKKPEQGLVILEKAKALANQQGDVAVLNHVAFMQSVWCNATPVAAR